ncbi:MAG: ammonia-forming cytochrome c nitrite reductase subunit c552 [Coriobacteriia bacterium]|nr:ammonia-forming cytochrome c nitrite reductase subunit c552 [Coriobacteriia bacterium]MCL2537144.1 ammonia-forming cytochrome c nitrite reductase subunit c552 [Coriobacteriia bacterium]
MKRFGKGYVLTAGMTMLAMLLLLAVSTGSLLGCSDNTPAAMMGKSTGLPADTISNEAFKDKFPLQYESYMLNGQGFPELSELSKFELDREPLFPILFYKSAFSYDYNKSRGHGYADNDVAHTLRTNDETKGGCYTCKSSAVPRLIEERGDAFYTDNLLHDIIPAAEAMGTSPVGCTDCHNPTDMTLRAPRPHFKEGLAERGIDSDTAPASDQRSYVCAQCHLSYYFNAKTNVVTLPWTHLNVPRQTAPNDYFNPAEAQPGDAALQTYVYFQTKGKERGFEQDFVHGISGVPILKPRHPEFEMCIDPTGAHGDQSCATCHMPRAKADDGTEYTNHHLGSPLENPVGCTNCHGDNMEPRITAARSLQAAYRTKLERAQELGVRSHYYVNRMVTVGVDADIIDEVRGNIQFAQWLWDFCAAENSSGFHNPKGFQRVLDLSIDSSTGLLAVATNALVEKGVDIAQLDDQIEQTIAAVKAETDTSKKRDFAVNEWFPALDQ